MPESSESDPATAPAESQSRRTPKALKYILALVVLLAMVGVTVALSAYWLGNRPKPQRRGRRPQSTLVEVRPVQAAPADVSVSALGTVVPAREVQLSSRVAGEVLDVAPQLVPGGRFEAGDPMIRIDPNDYRLAVDQQQAELQRLAALVTQQEAMVEQRQTDVVRAEAQLALEMGQQAVARREYELLGETLDANDQSLVLREPQLRSARAAIEAAKAARNSARGTVEATRSTIRAAEVALDKARLQLERTRVRAPFAATVLRRHVEQGSAVSPGTPLTTLAGTEEYWVEVSVPVDELAWIEVPGHNAPVGSPARIYHQAAWGPDAHRAGRVAGLLAGLEPQGRMAQLLIAVRDPLALGDPPAERNPLLLGAYVRVEIAGRQIPRAVAVPRIALREGQNVWVMTDANSLDIRPVQIAWTEADRVLVTDGLDTDEKLIVSNLATPVQGMPLRTAPADSPGSQADQPRQASDAPDDRGAPGSPRPAANRQEPAPTGPADRTARRPAGAPAGKESDDEQ